MKDKDIRFDDLEHIKREISRLETKVSDYLCKDNLREINEWSFEYSSREAEYKNLPKEHTNILHYVRKYLVLVEAYGMLYSNNLNNNDATELRLNLPDYSVIDKMIRKDGLKFKKK